jgi:2-polyprenyl-6-methoxyphenol hydroxylase-like FAD-dependent oxidoreductase
MTRSVRSVQSVDVAIVGGGPGGCATALSLHAYAPSLSVALIEASSYEEPRLGETLPPVGRRLLEHLGVWEAFQLQPHQPLYGTAAAWGTPDVREHPFIYSTRGAGWHLDRRAFDACLAQQMVQRGVTLLRATRVRDLTPQPEPAVGWRLHLESSESSESMAAVTPALDARVVVDATGRTAMVARRLGGRCLGSDRLVALTRLFDQRETGDPRTLVETFRDGWWYTARLPGDQRIVCCMTDADIARSLCLHEQTVWSRLLSSMDHVSGALRNASPMGPIVTRAVGSRLLDPVAGDGWLAVGDAASMFDPLSSQGIVKALRSGIFASYAIADLLSERDLTGMTRYAAYVQAEFEAYARTYTKYYGEERRWPDSLFWKRRSGLQAADHVLI